MATSVANTTGALAVGGRAFIQGPGHLHEGHAECRCGCRRLSPDTVGCSSVCCSVSCRAVGSAAYPSKLEPGQCPVRGRLSVWRCLSRPPRCPHRDFVWASSGGWPLLTSASWSVAPLLRTVGAKTIFGFWPYGAFALLRCGAQPCFIISGLRAPIYIYSFLHGVGLFSGSIP